jgi:hypothetical protein
MTGDDNSRSVSGTGMGADSPSIGWTMMLTRLK